MDPSLRIADPYANSTYLHPLVALLLIMLLWLTLSRSRGAAMAALLIVMNFVTSAQRISLVGIDFPIIRILIIFSLFRILVRREYEHSLLNDLDKVIIYQIVVTAFTSYIRHPTFSELTYILSTDIDALGGYFVVRNLIRNREDFHRAVSVLMWISFPIVGMFIFERLTGRNPMAVFGGVAEFTWIREGKMRVQGPYPHVILAGSFWATVVPLFLAAGSRKGKQQPLMYIAAVSGMVIIVLCGSTTPLMAIMAGLCAIVLYFQRNMLGRLKAIVFAAVLALVLFWKHPIWYLVVKVDFTGGSTGWFRFYLIDSFIKNWKEWILIGTRTTEHWGYGLIDVCNQYVAAGVNGGILGFVSFILYIFIAFTCIGALISGTTDSDERRDYWFLGVSIFVHLFNFIGVSYFSQISLCWWITMGFCSSLYQAKSPAPSGTGLQIRSLQPYRH